MAFPVRKIRSSRRINFATTCLIRYILLADQKLRGLRPLDTRGKTGPNYEMTY